MFNFKIQTFCIFAFVLTFGGLSVIGAGLPMKTVWETPKSIIVTPEQQQTLTFPAIKKKKGYILCLAFKAYLYSPKAGGWNPYIALSLNGLQLDKFTRDGNKRLFCRKDVFTTTHPRVKQRSWWGVSCGKPSIMTFMGPGIGGIDKRVTSARQEGYNYFLDISDAANYLVIGADNRIESDKSNVLSLSNTLPKQYLLKMHYDDIRIGYVKKNIANKARGAVLIKFKKGTPVAVLKEKKITLKIMKSGGMLLENNGDKYWFRSLFSYPGNKEIQYSKLGISNCFGYSTWKPKVHKKGDKIEISAHNKNVTLLRTITFKKQHILINDKLTNRTNKPVGVAISNIVGVKNIPVSGSFRLSGMESNFENKCAENPTCFIAQKNGSIGIVAEDNVFRFNLELLKRNNTFVISNKNLGIAGKKSYTFEWTIFPLKSKKYFSLINKIRQAWGSNYTIFGPICLFARDIIDQKIRKTNITLAPQNIWFEYHNGAELSRDNYKKQYDTVVSMTKKRAPSIKIMPRLETNLITLNTTNIPGGEIIPSRKSNIRSNGKYGLCLTKAQTAILNRTKYADSIIRDVYGNAVIDTFYPKYPHINLLVHPAKNNYRLKQMLEQIDYALDDLKADGIYYDQFVPSKSFYDTSYDKWDGSSVTLDKKGNIKQKFYAYALAGSTARAEILKKILSKGKLVLTNGQPVTRETQNLPVLRFHEMENDKFNPMNFIDEKPPIFKNQTMCHLGCPMILGQRIGYAKWYGTKDPGRNLTKSIITALRNGLLYCYYTSFPQKNVAYGPVNHMFPFTPVKLNEGYLIGKERIITCISGKYIWPHSKKPKCFYFDCRGFDKDNNFKMTQQGDTWEVEVKLDDWNEIAVIEK